jgi:farnesyl-diphosphate farnesyltransferase
MVIRELPEGLRVPICVFYLVLRALDTIEDDMTLYIDRKREMLETFHEKLSDESYTFNESGPNEKDAVLLRHFYVVSQVYMSKSSKKAKASRFEFEKEGLTNEQREIIKDICEKMGKGMADSLRDDSILVDVTKIVSVNKNISDYNRYCYHVAGLVGIGLCKLFISPVLKASEERGEVLKILEPFLPEYHLSKGGGYSGECGDSLANSMALFLQKVNIIRDFHEDLLEGRAFWPESVTKKYSTFLHQLQDLNCVYELVMDVLQLVPDCIQFLSALSDPHIFAFCAIPQVCFLSMQQFEFNY